MATVINAILATLPVHFMRTVLAHACRSGRRVADQLHPSMPELAALIGTAEPDVLDSMGFPTAHRVKFHSTNPLECINGEIKHRTGVFGIFPNETAITRLVGAIPLEQSDDWAVQRSSYMTL